MTGGEGFLSVPAIGAEDLRLLLEGGPRGLWVLDTRMLGEYERGHLPGSLHCPVHELSHRERDLPPRSTTVVVVGEAGTRGRAGGIFLLLAGFGSVLLLEGGFPAWKGPVESGPPPPLASTRPRKPPGWVDPPSPPSA